MTQTISTPCESALRALVWLSLSVYRLVIYSQVYQAYQVSSIFLKKPLHNIQYDWGVTLAVGSLIIDHSAMVPSQHHIRIKVWKKTGKMINQGSLLFSLWTRSILDCVIFSPSLYLGLGCRKTTIIKLFIIRAVIDFYCHLSSLFNVATRFDWSLLSVLTIFYRCQHR